MSPSAQARHDVQRPLRLSLDADPTAAAEARGYVRAAIYAWGVPVDPYVAALLTSELVTNAIRHETGEKVKLFVSCSCGHLRVYVHDSSRTWPVPLNAAPDAEAGAAVTAATANAASAAAIRHHQDRRNWLSVPDKRRLLPQLSAGITSAASRSSCSASSRIGLSRISSAPASATVRIPAAHSSGGPAKMCSDQPPRP